MASLKPAAPLAMLMELTHRCPLRCAYCSNPLALTPTSAELPTAAWKAALDEAATSQLHSLSEPFFRPDSARTRSAGGVGLGLTLCRLVAQAHGGTLEISNARPGLRVVVTLPARLAAR